MFFKHWIKQCLFPGDWDVIGLDLPGRNKLISKDCFHAMRPLVECIADSLGSALLGDAVTPLAFFGHSLGAYVAYELAREIRRRELICDS